MGSARTPLVGSRTPLFSPSKERAERARRGLAPGYHIWNIPTATKIYHSELNPEDPEIFEIDYSQLEEVHYTPSKPKVRH